MATYTLTLNLAGFAVPNKNAVLVLNSCGLNINCNNYQDIQDIASELAFQINDQFISQYGGGSITYIITGESILFTMITNDESQFPCNSAQLVALSLIDNESNYFSGAWVLVGTTPCPTCQEVTITNCGPVAISLPLPDEDYTVTLYDNQSGVAYTQNVQWTSGTGTWNTTNTAGVFTPFSIYTLTVTDSQGEPVSWPVGPNEYTCARVTFSATVDTND